MQLPGLVVTATIYDCKVITTKNLILHLLVGKGHSQWRLAVIV